MARCLSVPEPYPFIFHVPINAEGPTRFDACHILVYMSTYNGGIGFPKTPIHGD